MSSLKSPMMAMYQSQVGGMQQNQPKASPPRMGFVTNEAANKGLNGYVGEKPPVKEEGGNPQQRRQMTSFASPDPMLSQQAFTQSQFTQSISQGAMQSQSARSEGGVQDQRLENLRRYKESQGRGGMNRGGSCNFTPHPSFQQFQGRQNSNNNNSLSRSTEETSSLATVSPTTSDSSVNYISYYLTDAGYMYKTYTPGQSWFRVMNMIIPDGKIVKKIYVSCVMPKTTSADETPNNINTAEQDFRYSLRIVDPNNVQNGRQTQIWADYGFENTQNFERHVIDLTNNPNVPKGGMLELQAHNAMQNPILFSAIVLEITQ